MPPLVSGWQAAATGAAVVGMTWVGSTVRGGDATGFGAVAETRRVGLGAGRVVAGALLVAGPLDAGVVIGAVVAAAAVAGAGTDGVVDVADGGVLTLPCAEQPMTGTTTKAPMAMPAIVTENLMLSPLHDMPPGRRPAKPGVAGVSATVHDELTDIAHQELLSINQAQLSPHLHQLRATAIGR